MLRRLRARWLGRRTPRPLGYDAGHNAGHVVVVLDPQSSDPELTHLLTESGAPVLLHDDEQILASS